MCPADPDPPTGQAHALAARAAQAAGITVREVHDLPELEQVRRLFDRIWAADPTNPTVTAELLRAYVHTGQYVAVAEDLTLPGRPLAAASVAFLSAPAGTALHSHVTGVLATGRGRALGFALKAHQRAWALDRGLREITWTFDPLVRRNAWFNLAKLRARVREYLEDFYGSMADGLNAGDSSDRLYLAWPVADPAVAATLESGPAGIDLAAERAAGAVPVLSVSPGGAPAVSRPTPVGATTVLVQVPVDVETLRRTDPERARDWRRALRQVLGGAVQDGWDVRGVGRDGWYVLDRPGRAGSGTGNGGGR